MLLGELAPGIKCRNAGASLLSIDIPFNDLEALRRAVNSNVINPEAIAKIYGTKPSDVQIYVYEPAQAIKITLPRDNVAGGIAESDFDGAQQFAPLLDIVIPD